MISVTQLKSNYIAGGIQPVPLGPQISCPVAGSGDLNNDNQLTSYDVFLVGAIYVQVLLGGPVIGNVLFSSV